MTFYKDIFDRNNSLICEFSTKYDEEKKKLPYRFNVFNHLRTNENAHSAILQQLFSYPKNNFHALQSFLEFLQKENKTEFQFDCSQIVEPKITTEHHRIDVLIAEKGKYAIIIENKIHYAVEQENQMERYIEKCKNLGFNETQIYILYLTRFGGEPSNFSLNKSRNLFQKGKRYLPISFNVHIYDWLKEYLKKIDNTEDIFKSAIIQYLDHLEELLQKPKYEKMNTELNKFLTEKLALGNKNTQEKKSIIDEKISEIENIKIQLYYLKEENEMYFFFEKREEQIKKEFPNYEIINTFKEDQKYPKLGIFLKHNNCKFSALIEIEKESKSIYFGFGWHFSEEQNNNNFKNFLHPLMKSHSLTIGNSEWWYGKKFSNYESVYSEFKNLLKETLENLDKQS